MHASPEDKAYELAPDDMFLEPSPRQEGPAEPESDLEAAHDDELADEDEEPTEDIDDATWLSKGAPPVDNNVRALVYLSGNPLAAVRCCALREGWFVGSRSVIA